MLKSREGVCETCIYIDTGPLRSPLQRIRPVLASKPFTSATGSRPVGDIRQPASPAKMQPPLRGRNVRSPAKRTCARNEVVIG
jgi:hypothetical protein